MHLCSETIILRYDDEIKGEVNSKPNRTMTLETYIIGVSKGFGVRFLENIYY